MSHLNQKLHRLETQFLRQLKDQYKLIFNRRKSQWVGMSFAENSRGILTFLRALRAYLYNELNQVAKLFPDKMWGGCMV